MQEWQNSICITFKERSLEEDYIEFAYEGGYGIDNLNITLFNYFQGYRATRQLSDCCPIWSEE